MEAKVVLDISSVVWDESDFKKNQSSYYCLASEFIIFVQAFESCKNLRLVARSELLNNIRGQFPHYIPNSAKLFTFKKRALQFLSNNRYVTYIADSNSLTANSIPNICHNYFSNTLKIEVRYLLSEIHKSENHIFCTFTTRWQNNDKLKTINATTKEHHTIIHGEDKLTIKDFYETSFRNIFDHNPKHDSLKGVYFNGSEKVNPLSCYDERKADTTIPQKYLDDAIQYGNDFFNYDGKNRTFVCFKNHTANKYHGYDEDIDNVPQKIKEKFHK
jgi:hypothetical protein